MSNCITPFSLKDAPALIERLLPVQKLSVEAYKEQMAGSGKTLTALGSYWKGRKPLILNKAWVLGCLLPATDDPARDLEIFEKLMAMDDESFVARWKRRSRPKEILATLSITRLADYFTVEPERILPDFAPVDWSKPEYAQVKIAWRADCSELERRRLEAQMLPRVPYRERVDQAQRPEEVMDTVHDHIWNAVNDHLGTSAHSFPELVEQLGIMRFGHRPRVADTFCGSGQIPFEAARLGCDVYASDLNPVACMLTWGAFNIVGGSEESREKLTQDQRELVRRVQAEIDRLGVETDGNGWRAKAFLYCLEVRCPQSGWMVPLIPSLIVSTSRKVIVELLPDPINWRYHIQIRTGVSVVEMREAETGTVGREGKYGEAYLTHHVDGVNYKTKISTLRGDYQKPDGTIDNRLRLWEKHDFQPRPDDLLQERLYCIQWMRPKNKGKGYDYEFRAVTPEDLEREHIVEEFIAENLADWQAQGWVPDMRIEVGGPPRYQGLDLIRARGWTHWHHLFSPRQLLVNGLIDRFSKTSALRLGVCQATNFNSKLSRWNYGPGVDAVIDTFYNQALNTLYNYGSRSSHYIVNQVAKDFRSFPLPPVRTTIQCIPARRFDEQSDVFVTDPPYGDAIKYEEILDFFIAWLRKNPPPEFADWVWDSRRSLAIKGEDEDFRRGMVAAYKRMTGLNQEARGLYRDENVFEDADLQMAGYAAALRVLTRYAIIDGRDMTAEAVRPRVKGETTFVDGLIAFAVDTANQCLVPSGIAKAHWDGPTGAERFYLKLVDLEASGLKTLDNYQNFAKAFKVRDFRALMASQKANQARLKSAVEFGKTEMSDSSELHQSVLRAVLYAMMELVQNVDSNEVLAHLTLNVPDYYASQTQRNLVVELADYLARKLETQRPDEASAARILRELVRHQRLG